MSNRTSGPQPHPSDAAATAERLAISCALYHLGPGPLLACGLRASHFSSTARGQLWSGICEDAKKHTDGRPDSHIVLEMIRTQSDHEFCELGFEFSSTAIDADPRHATDYARDIIRHWKSRTTAERCLKITRIQTGEIEGDVAAELAAIARIQAEGLPVPVPVSDTLTPVPAFSAELIPAALRPWLVDTQARIGCPLEFLAVAAVVAAGTVIGRKLGIRPKMHDDWTEYPNLWGALVGRPSTMKSPALSEALRPLSILEARARDSWKSEMVEHEKAQARRVIERDAARDGAKKAARKGLAFDVDGILAGPGMEEPPLRRYTVTKSSLQALVEILRQNPNGLLLTHDELSGLLTQLDQPGNEDMRAFFLTAWTGKGSFTLDTIGRGLGHHVPAVCLSMLGGIQPVRLAAHVRDAVNNGAGDDGFVQRLQCAVWPDDPGEWRAVDRWPDTAARKIAFDVFERLDALTPDKVNAEADESDESRFLRFVPEVVPDFLHWMEEITARARVEAATLPAMEAHLIKYRGLLPRLALTFHLLADGRGPVTVDAWQLARCWTELLEAHARRIYTHAAAPDKGLADRLRHKLQTAVREGTVREPFKAPDIYRKGWSGLTDPRAVTTALEILAAHHWLIEEPPGLAFTGRPPASEYRLHPYLKQPAPLNHTP